MVKKALCVGINDYPDKDLDLKGCVNDLWAWAGLLTTHYDFPRDQVKVLADSQATKRSIVDGIKDLLAGSRAGDVLVFTNSSHGTYVADSTGDELKYDEALCPYDVKENVIIDDELRELFAELPAGVGLTIISDSCHSGTATRALTGLPTPDDRRRRFYNPELRGGVILSDPWRVRSTHAEKFPEESMREVLLSGCTDTEYSFDALIDGTYHGAMTFHAIKAITEAGYKLTYAELHARLLRLLEEAQYNQHPQLEGSTQNKQRQLFT